MTEVTTAEFTPLTLEQLTWFELSNGAYCFVGNVDDICKHVEAHGFQIYYVMSTMKEETKNGNVTTNKLVPMVFKVIKNAVGRAVVPAKDDFDLDIITPEAFYALPKIPYSMVKKMDDFFRTVHEMYGTEAIVILTYDPDYATAEDPSEGWGVVVPDQENTSGFCDYTHESISQEKPEHVIQVGSVHSHPGMSAFASGTDHNDQAEFDGIHITYGWQKSKNGGSTEYHIELQMGGHSFQMKPEQVFGDMPVEEVSEEIKDWTAKVKKKHHTTTSSTTGKGWSGGGTGTTGGTYSPKSPAERWKQNLPSGHPNVEESIFIGEVKDGEQDCPFCQTKLITADVTKRRCLACHNYLCLPGETLKDVFTLRDESKVYSYDLDVDQAPPKSIYIWNRTGDNKFELVYDSQSNKVGELGKS